MYISNRPPPPPPPPGMGSLKPPNPPSLSGSNPSLNSSKTTPNTSAVNDSDGRKLTKLHWREAQQMFNAGKDESIWNSITPIEIDKEKLAYLFELKQMEVKTKVNFANRRELFFV